MFFINSVRFCYSKWVKSINPQTLLEECKYKLTKKKMNEDLITDDFNSSSESDGESDGESEDESCNE